MKQITKAQPSTAFSGMGLFDWGLKVGNFTGDPSTRGMIDRWRHNTKKKIYVTVEPNEDYPDYSKSECEVWFFDDKLGVCEWIDGGSDEHCLKSANEFMLNYKEK